MLFSIVIFALMILVIFLPLNWFLWGIPEIKWTNYGHISEYQLHGDNVSIPAVGYDYIINFTAIGSFSVNNPIKIHIKLLDVTLPNFLEYYQIVGLSKAYAVPFKYDSNGALESASIELKQTDSNTYEGEGTVIWMVSEPVYGPIAIPSKSNVHLTGGVIEEIFAYIFTVSGVSNTLAQNYSASNNKLSVLLLLLGIIVTVAEATLLRNK